MTTAMTEKYPKNQKNIQKQADFLEQLQGMSRHKLIDLHRKIFKFRPDRKNTLRPYIFNEAKSAREFIERRIYLAFTIKCSIFDERDPRYMRHILKAKEELENPRLNPIFQEDQKRRNVPVCDNHKYFTNKSASSVAFKMRDWILDNLEGSFDDFLVAHEKDNYPYSRNHFCVVKSNLRRAGVPIPKLKRGRRGFRDSGTPVERL